MRRWQWLSIILAGAILTGGIFAPPVLAQGRGQGFRPCPYTPYSCPVSAVCRPFDEKGKVVQVMTETLEALMQPGMALVLDTKNRGQVQVSLGPVWYLERQEFEFKPGDEVQVKGMCEDTKDGKLRVIAYEVIKDDHVLALRDAQGLPNWEAWRKK